MLSLCKQIVQRLKVLQDKSWGGDYKSYRIPDFHGEVWCRMVLTVLDSRSRNYSSGKDQNFV